MKKLLILVVLLVLVLPVFADDALVLPQGVLRISIAPSYGFANKTWDKDGEAQDIIPNPLFTTNKSDGIQYFNLGIALEYGVNDWITAALQWTPGWNLWSTMGFDKQPIGPSTYLYFDQGVLGSYADLFAGAKIQIVGKKAPVVNDTMRFSIAPGVKIPMPGDSKPTQADLVKDETHVLKEIDNHLWGLGGRLYFDYNVTSEFFVNLYSEFIYYPEQKTDKNATFGDKTKVAKGYDWTIEIEPQYWAPVADGLVFKAFLPFTYKMTPDYKIEGTKQADSASTILSVTPALGLFFTKTFMPIELEVGYRYPLMGTNNTIMNVVYILGRFYMKF